MGFLDLLGWLVGHATPTETDEVTVDDRVIEMAEQAPGDGVTPEVLANRFDRADRALVEYVEEDERPAFVFRGSTLLISDEDDSLARKYPTRETQILITDDRILVVLGGRLNDDIWGIPFDDVVEAYVDDEGRRRYLVVESDREENPMTFFADVTLETNWEDLHAGVEYVRDRAANESEADG